MDLLHLCPYLFFEKLSCYNEINKKRTFHFLSGLPQKAAPNDRHFVARIIHTRCRDELTASAVASNQRDVTYMSTGV